MEDTAVSPSSDTAPLSPGRDSLSDQPASANPTDNNGVTPENAIKNVFIFTSSGKPIFAKVGNEEDLVTTFGFLQAVVSIVLASGDIMKCIVAGNRKIVFLLKQSLYFVIISSTKELECILLKQLDFLYQQILFILTSKVHSILENNPATDLRSLLGSDSDRLIRAACDGNLVPVPVAFHALPTLCIEKSLREDVFGQLKTAVEASKAAMGLLMYEGQVFAIQNNSSIDLAITTGDAIILTNFISRSTVFKTQDQHWVPVCFPGFNAQGYLQAYISSIAVREPKDGIDGLTMFLVLVAVSNDPSSFKDLIEGKHYMEKALRLPEINTRLIVELAANSMNVNKLRDSNECLHFFFKMCPISKRGGENKIGICQYITCEGKFPFHFPEEQDNLILEYEKLALRLRRGSSQWESTLFPPLDTTVENRRASLQNLMRGRKAPARYSPTFSKGETNAKLYEEGDSNKMEPIDATLAFEDGVAIMTSLPNADHQLVCETLTTGIILIGLATYDCELYMTFPSTFDVMKASVQADNFMRFLRSNAMLFLCTRESK